MSEELIDDSILNADGSNGSNVGEGGGGSNIDLNEDQIAELLGDNSADTVEENITTSESQEEIREAVLTDFEAESSEAALEEGRAEDLQIPVVEIDQDVLLANVSSQNMDEGYDENDVIIDDEVEEIHQNIEDFVEEEGLSEEVLIDDGEVAARQENTLLGQEMEEIFEHDDDVIPMEADDIEIISDVNRKRAGGDKSAPSPVPKRQRRVQTCFELRQQWIEMVSRLYGSWDAQISVSNLQFIKNLSIANQRRLIDVHIQNENILKTEIRSLREQLLQERRAHTATRVALKTLTEDANVMRKQLGKLSDMITQPTTAKLLDAFFPRTQTDHDTDNTPPRSHPNVLATAQQACRSAYHVPRTTPSQSRPLPQKQIYSTLERVQSLTSNRQYAKSYINMAQASAVPQNHYLDTSIRPAGVVLPPARIHPSRAPAAARSVSIKWQAIPPPQNGNLGHTEPQLPGNCRQPLIDTTKQGDNTIMLCIPLVSPHNIISSGDSSRLPVGPKIYQGIQANPDLTVTIHSTSQDFRENYQIGGKVNYEYLGNLDQKSIQILVQVSSLKFSGMHGKPDPAVDIPIDWGCSNLWPCKSKSHKFRVKFHHQQLLPVHDRITVVVVVRDTINDSLEISQPAFLNLE